MMLSAPVDCRQEGAVAGVHFEFVKSLRRRIKVIRSYTGLFAADCSHACRTWQKEMYECVLHKWRALNLEWAGDAGNELLNSEARFNAESLSESSSEPDCDCMLHSNPRGDCALSATATDVARGERTREDD